MGNLDPWQKVLITVSFSACAIVWLAIVFSVSLRIVLDAIRVIRGKPPRDSIAYKFAARYPMGDWGRYMDRKERPYVALCFGVMSMMF